MTLHVFEFDDGEEHWVAETADEALRLHAELNGCNCIETGEHTVEQMPDDAPKTICVDANGKIANHEDWDGKSKRTRPCREWAEEYGKGMLCTVNW